MNVFSNFNEDNSDCIGNLFLGLVQFVLSIVVSSEYLQGRFSISTQRYVWEKTSEIKVEKELRNHEI